MTEKNSRCQTPLSQIFKYKFSFYLFPSKTSICLSDLVSAFSSTVYRHKKHKQKITVNFRVKQVLFFDISGGVSHRTGRHDIMIIAFFGLLLLHFFLLRFSKALLLYLEAEIVITFLRWDRPHSLAFPRSVCCRTLQYPLIYERRRWSQSWWPPLYDQTGHHDQSCE